MAENKAVVRGDRICRQCKGICHKNSWRTKHGLRKVYFCSEGCARRHNDGKVQHIANDLGVVTWFKMRLHDDEWVELRDLIYEPVDVITK